MAFYKKEEFVNFVQKVPNYIVSPDYELNAIEHYEYTYPVDGWYWFDTDDEAKEFFGIDVVE